MELIFFSIQKIKEASLTDWLMVAVTFLLVVIGGIQLGLFYWQLRLMRKSINDIEITANAAKVSAEAANKQTNIAEIAFTATHRPWVKTDIQISGPLFYNINGMSITLLFNTTNIGNSPAINVDIDFRTILLPIGIETTNYVQIQKQICNDAKLRIVNSGQVIFPNDTIPYLITNSVNNEDIKRATQKVNFIHPFIVGCITYKSVFDEKYHQTGFIYEIRRSDRPRAEAIKKNRSPSAIFIDDGDIPANELIVYRSPLNGFTAD